MPSSKSEEEEQIEHVEVNMPFCPYDYYFPLLHVMKLHGDGGSISTGSSATVDLTREVISISSTSLHKSISDDTVQHAQVLPEYVDSAEGSISDTVQHEEVLPEYVDSGPSEAMEMLGGDEMHPWVVVCPFCGEPICRCVELVNNLENNN